MALEEESLLQSAEKRLVGRWVLNGAQIELRAGAHDQLGLVSLTYGGGEADEIAPMPERSP